MRWGPTGDSFLSMCAARPTFVAARERRQPPNFKKFSTTAHSEPTLTSYPLSYVGLARAYTLTGNTVKAKAAYQDFLTLWKDADPDIPIFIAAKAEYAKLQ